MKKWRARTVSLEGQTFGMLTVLYVSPSAGRERRWLCRCECGGQMHAIEASLLEGKARSCGCVFHTATHNMSDTREWRSWKNMNDRCGRAKNTAFSRYGGRGITVCAEWQRSFEAFYRDMGPCPSPEHTIERRENEKGYSKNNCYWATRWEQDRNKRTNRYIEFEGERHILSDWAKIADLSVTELTRRLNSGWSVRRALVTPRKWRCEKDTARDGDEFVEAEWRNLD